jgi:hypothetical protein
MGATLDRSSNGDVTLLTKSAARVALEQATVRGAVTKLKFRKRPDQASASFEVRVGALPGQVRAQARRSEYLTRVG